MRSHKLISLQPYLLFLAYQNNQVSSNRFFTEKFDEEAILNVIQKLENTPKKLLKFVSLKHSSDYPLALRIEFSESCIKKTSDALKKNPSLLLQFLQLKHPEGYPLPWTTGFSESLINETIKSFNTPKHLLSFLSLDQQGWPLAWDDSFSSDSLYYCIYALENHPEEMFEFATLRNPINTPLIYKNTFSDHMNTLILKTLQKKPPLLKTFKRMILVKKGITAGQILLRHLQQGQHAVFAPIF